MPTILAHGGLGAWDEVIFLSIGAIFLIMMGISWVKSRASQPEPEAVEEAKAPAEAARENESPERFRLE